MTPRPALLAMSLCGALLAVPAAAAPPAPCPPEGDGGNPSTNRLMNRPVEPKSYQPMTVQDVLLKLPVTLYTPKDRSAFLEKHFEALEATEYKGVALVGHVVDASLAAPHAANCRSGTRRDIELRLSEEKPASTADARRLRAQSVVVAVTPSGQERQPAWNLKTLAKLAKNGAKVRVSGWMFYDSERQDELARLRGTLWELHPVTKIEVWKDGSWVDL